MREVTKSELLIDLERQIKYVCGKMGVPRDIRKSIVSPDTILVFNLIVPYKGEIVTKTAIRIQHTLPSGGGCRVAEVKKIPEAMAEAGFLSFLMSLKLGVAGEEFVGGGKAIVITDPTNTPRELLDLLFVEFGRKMAPVMLGRDRIAPDMYTDDRDIEKIIEGLTIVLGKKIDECQIRALATGKKPDGTWKGGILGRPESTGWGVAYAAKLAAERINLPTKGTTVVIQGFGKVGVPAAERMIEYGAIVIAVSNRQGGIVNRSGLNIEDLKDFKKKNGTLIGFPRSYYISNEKLLEMDCDFLMPCATEGQIIEENADRINTKIISEGSNMGITGKAKRILSDKGIIVLDGVFANLAGVITSILEAEQNKEKKVYTLEKSVENFESIIKDSFREIHLRMKKYDISLPDATLALGIERVIKIRFGMSIEELLAERKNC